MKSNLVTTESTQTPRFLSDEALHAQCPAAFAESPADHVSKNYRFVPTTQIIDQLKTFEYGVVGSMSQMGITKNAKGERVKTLKAVGQHSLTFEPKEQHVIGKNIGRIQLTMINSHDTSRRLDLRASIYRLVCSNGLVTGASFASLHLTHLESSMATIDKALTEVIESADRAAKLVNRMAKVKLNDGEQKKFAELAMKARYGDQKSKWKISPEQLLGVRREEDKDNSLWVVFNRIQENVLRGGLRSELTGFSTVPVVSPVKAFATNANLWDIAESYLS